MMITIGKIYITALILYVLFWIAIEMLWEDNHVGDCFRDVVMYIGERLMGFTLLGGIAVFAILLIVTIWK